MSRKGGARRTAAWAKPAHTTERRAMHQQPLNHHLQRPGAHAHSVSSCCLEGEAELPSVSALTELWNRLLYRDRHRDTSSKTASRFLSGRVPDLSGYGAAPLSTADAFPQAWIQVHAPPQRTSTSSRRGGPRRDLGSTFPRTTPNCAAA